MNLFGCWLLCLVFIFLFNFYIIILAFVLNLRNYKLMIVINKNRRSQFKNKDNSKLLFNRFTPFKSASNSSSPTPQLSSRILFILPSKNLHAD